MAETQATSVPEEIKKLRLFKKSRISEGFGRFIKRKTSVAGLVILLVLILAAIFAPFLARYDYQALDPIHAFQAPSAEHWFGTDVFGRDLFSRMLYGARYSLSLSFAAQAIGTLVAILLGGLAGYFGGTIDTIIQRLCDVIQSLPNILLCICVAQALGSGFIPTAIALSIGGMAADTRLLRATMMSVRGLEYVEAAQAINCSKPRIIFKHVVKNCLAPMIISATMGLGVKIMTSASLSYLGLGVQEPTPEWGAMIAGSKQYFRYYPYLVIIPGLFIALVVLAYNLVGDGLRDAMDPKLRT